jgi:hypothetical protein
MAWLYAACNVVSRKLKDFHFTLIAFYHAVVGLIIAVVFISGRLIITGEGLPN